MKMLICDGSITETSGDLVCSSGWSTQIATVPFDISQIDPTVATALFVSGFFLVHLPIAMAWGIKYVLSIIR